MMSALRSVQSLKLRLLECHIMKAIGERIWLSRSDAESLNFTPLKTQNVTMLLIIRRFFIGHFVNRLSHAEPYNGKKKQNVKSDSFPVITLP